MNCRNCGAELLPGKRFCHACGAPALLECPNCHASVESGFRFCPDCGLEIGASPAETARSAGAVGRGVSVSTSMPEAMAEKIRASRAAIEGERKQVSVLFCDLAGSTTVAGTLDPEEYHDLLDQYLELAIHQVYRFEGIVNQLAGDGLMALFGAPIAHEDDPQRAVRAALAIRDALAEFNQRLQTERGLALPARIGINTGPVVVGTVGTDMKMDYTAVGDTTNLAARLESLASPGAVLISEATARLVRGFFEMRSVGPLAVKGKSEPVSAYEVREVSAGASPMALAAARGLTPLAGRDEELAQLDACFRRLDGCLAQVVAVVGDAGSGKSRILYEFKERLAGEAVVFFEGRCSALSQTEPFFPFMTMLQQYFELRPGDSVEVACEKVARKVGVPRERIDGYYPLACRLLSIPIGDPGDVPPEELKRQSYDAMTSLVLGVSQQAPVVMIVEDLQWIDEPSRELLEMAVSRLARARVMLLVSHRPEYRPAWRAAAAVTQLNLRPLFDEEITRIVRAVAGGTFLPELEELILAKAEGSPFFAEEITRALFEEGHLTCDDGGGCRLTRPVEEIRIPGTVQEVLAARLDRLRAPAKRTAQVAAVLGRQFSRPQLEQLLAPENIDVGGELTELEQRGVIHRQNLFSDDEYRFGESLTQEVAYESLLLKQRRQIHERIGRLLETDSVASPTERPALIAHHFARSDNREKAVETLLRAAEEAERLPSYSTARKLYMQVWEVADDLLRGGKDPDGRVRRWLLAALLGYSRGTIIYGSSDDREAERAVQRGCELAGELGEEGSLAGFHTISGMMLSGDRERFGEGLAAVERGVALAERVNAPLTLISISRALAWTYLLDGRFELARQKIDWMLEELEHLGERERLTDLYLGARSMQERTCFFRDDLDGAQRTAMETYELGLRASNRTVQGMAANGLAQVHFVRGEPGEARRWADRSLKIAEEIDNIGSIHRAATIAMAARVELGEPGNVERYMAHIEPGLHVGSNMLLSIGVVVEALLAIGDVERAERFARRAQDLGAGRLREMFATTAVGDVAVRLGPAYWPEAERCYERVIGLAEPLGARSILAAALLGAGTLARVRGEPEIALRRHQQALALFREVGFHHYAKGAERLLADDTAREASG